MSEQDLFEAALRARRHAACRYSGYAVGAAVLTAEGRVYAGANVENASYGLTVCAERVAIFKAVSEGSGALLTLLVLTQNGAYPCGACRQVAREFAPDGALRVLIASPEGITAECDLRDLLPHDFGPEALP